MVHGDMSKTIHTDYRHNKFGMPSHFFHPDENKWKENPNYMDDRILTYIKDVINAKPNDRCPCGSGKKYKKCCQ